MQRSVTLPNRAPAPKLPDSASMLPLAPLLRMRTACSRLHRVASVHAQYRREALRKFFVRFTELFEPWAPAEAQGPTRRHQGQPASSGEQRQQGSHGFHRSLSTPGSGHRCVHMAQLPLWQACMQSARGAPSIPLRPCQHIGSAGCPACAVTCCRPGEGVGGSSPAAGSVGQAAAAAASYAFNWQEPRPVALVGCRAGHPRVVLAAIVDALQQIPSDMSRGARTPPCILIIFLPCGLNYCSLILQRPSLILQRPTR